MSLVKASSVMARAAGGGVSAREAGAVADGVGSQSEKGMEGSVGLAARMVSTAADQSSFVAGWPGGGATKVEIVGCCWLSPSIVSRAALMSSLVSSGSGHLAQSDPGMGVRGEGGRNKVIGEGGCGMEGTGPMLVSRGSRSANVASKGTLGLASNVG